MLAFLGDRFVPVTLSYLKLVRAPRKKPLQEGTIGGTIADDLRLTRSFAVVAAIAKRSISTRYTRNWGLIIASWPQPSAGVGAIGTGGMP